MDNLDTPCEHIPREPTLHGVCIFCWRDRAGFLASQLAAADDRVSRLSQEAGRMREELNRVDRRLRFTHKGVHCAYCLAEAAAASWIKHKETCVLSLGAGLAVQRELEAGRQVVAAARELIHDALTVVAADGVVETMQTTLEGAGWQPRGHADAMIQALAAYDKAVKR